MGEFSDRIRQLEQQIGDGELEGKVTVDQVYAKYQHEDLTLKHLGGGRAKYLENPLYDDHREYYDRLADNVLHGSLQQAMVKNVEDLSKAVYDNAPMEFGDLRASGHPEVLDDGSQVYNRLPMVGRLTPEEIEIKQDLQRLGLGNRKGVDGFGGLD